MAVTVLEKYISIDEYAALCDISRKSVLHRIRAGSASAIRVDGIYAIDIQASPPRRFMHHKWKKPGGGVRTSHLELRAVISWCHGKGIRCYPYLRAILTGKMDGWIIAGEVFASVTDLESFVK
jgi:hypothetical protein